MLRSIMAFHRLADCAWPAVQALPAERTLALLPIGATEAHGPHLPLATDVVIAEAMVRAGGQRLAAAGWEALALPPLAYTAAPFAAGFAGTLSVSPETVTALLLDIARAVAGMGARALVLANAHLDPAHIGSLYAAIETWREAADQGDAAAARLAILFPDVTRKPWALRLSEEFKSGACHAGRYEGSIVLAERPELVRRQLAATLPANPVSLSAAIRDGKASFEEAGGSEAYFGDPAAATPEEGERTVEALGAILADAVAEALGEAPPSGPPPSLTGERT